MTNPRKKSGFTLIELLVVITVIGLISSIVLASINSAKLKTQDARVISDLVNLRTAAEMFFQGQSPNFYSLSASSIGYGGNFNVILCNGTYSLTGRIFTANVADAGGGALIMQDIGNATGVTSSNNPSYIRCQFGSRTTNSYAIIVPLPSSIASGYVTFACTDATGAIKFQDTGGVILEGYNYTSPINYGIVTCI